MNVCTANPVVNKVISITNGTLKSEGTAIPSNTTTAATDVSTVKMVKNIKLIALFMLYAPANTVTIVKVIVYIYKYMILNPVGKPLKLSSLAFPALGSKDLVYWDCSP